MPKLLIRTAVALALAIGGPAIVQTSAQPASEPPDSVTVVVEVQPKRNTEAAAALVVMNDMRAMMKRQPGFVSEALLRNLDTRNAPRYVHVSQWVSMAHWAAVLQAAEFARLSARGNEIFSISASAFSPVE